MNRAVSHPARRPDTTVQEMFEVETAFGTCLYIKIRQEQLERLTWREVWEVFADAYPDRWAVEVFPPASRLVDEANVYHLFVLPGEPLGMDIHTGLYPHGYKVDRLARSRPSALADRYDYEKKSL